MYTGVVYSKFIRISEKCKGKFMHKPTPVSPLRCTVENLSIAYRIRSYEGQHDVLESLGWYILSASNRLLFIPYDAEHHHVKCIELEYSLEYFCCGSDAETMRNKLEARDTK
jgi:hypothetical protein